MGDELHLDPALHARFWAKIVAGPDCWVWLGAHTADGYGCFRVGAHVRYAHRLVYAYFRPLEWSEVIDHLCCNRGCVNPAHMEPVCQIENTLRGFDRRRRKRPAA
jgi:hypothetical protein